MALGDLWIQRSFLQSKRLVPENDNAALVCNNRNLYDSLKAVPPVGAALPDIDITQDFNAEANATIPSLDTSVEAAMGISKVISMHLRGVTSKPITLYKNDLRNALVQLEQTDEAKYRKYLKRHVIVTALYYADSIALSFQKTVNDKLAFETQLKQMLKVDAEITYEGNTVVNVVMNNNTCPFAANLERGKNI
ncbi:MAG: hypothetical protein RL660_2693 [Bacteroidota bacterium]|jgi:hypothetical protein